MGICEVKVIDYVREQINSTKYKSNKTSLGLFELLVSVNVQ